LISLFKNQPLVSQPGTAWAYNNSGYVLLGAIIEAVTGQSYASFIEQRIFKPLHMQHSFYDSANRVTPLHVYGYQKTPDGFIQAEYLSMSQVYAAGALVSTLDDLVIWINALYNGKLIPADAFKLMTTPYRLNNGEPVAYGYGWSLNNHHGIPLIEHLGSLPGYTSYIIGAPEQHLISIVLSNGDNLSQTPEQIARQMMAKVLD
jgi:CubicO group peptidase (beta-lactamase class C family)